MTDDAVEYYLKCLFHSSTRIEDNQEVGRKSHIVL